MSLDGITNSHGLLIDIQRAMIQAARKVIFCVDHTKIGRRSGLPLCGLECVDAVVTDDGAPAEVVAAMRSQGMEVILAPVGGQLPPAKGGPVCLGGDPAVGASA